MTTLMILSFFFQAAFLVGIPALSMIAETVVLIGAGSAMFTQGLVADVLRQGWQGEIALVDIDRGALEVAEKMTRKMFEATGSTHPTME